MRSRSAPCERDYAGVTTAMASHHLPLPLASRVDMIDARRAPAPLRKQNPMARSRSVAVVGVGHTPYGKLPQYDAYELGFWALKEALADSSLRFEDIDGLIVNRIPDYQRFCEIAGLNPTYVSITPGQGRFCGVCH